MNIKEKINRQFTCPNDGKLVYSGYIVEVSPGNTATWCEDCVRNFLFEKQRKELYRQREQLERQREQLERQRELERQQELERQRELERLKVLERQSEESQRHRRQLEEQHRKKTLKKGRIQEIGKWAISISIGLGLAIVAGIVSLLTLIEINIIISGIFAVVSVVLIIMFFKSGNIAVISTGGLTVIICGSIIGFNDDIAVNIAVGIICIVGFILTIRLHLEDKYPRRRDIGW